LAGRPVPSLTSVNEIVAVESVTLATARSEIVPGAAAGGGGAGAETVTCAVPLLPSLVAVMVAEPAPAAVAYPVAETVATAALLVDHVTARPVSVLPSESSVLAVNCAT